MQDCPGGKKRLKKGLPDRYNKKNSGSDRKSSRKKRAPGGLLTGPGAGNEENHA